MTDLDNTPLVKAQVQLAPSGDVPPPGKTPLVMIALAGLILGGGLAWWWASDRGVAPAPVAAVEATEGAIPTASENARPLPPLDQMDIFLRTLLGALSTSPEVVKWLATDDLTRQLARGIDRVSRGESPASDLSIIAPQDVFATSGRRGQLIIDPRSYRRYDRITAAFVSLDPEAVARAYRTIQPRLDEAYRALGRAETGVDTATHVALQVLIATPVPNEPVRVVPGRGARFAFADPQLEQLRPAQKQLIRLGPENQQKVQARLREINAALAAQTTR